MKNDYMLAAALHQKGMILESISSFPDALNAYNQSLQIEEKIGDRAGEAQTLHQIGMVYQLMDQFEKALEYYDESLQIDGEIGNKQGERIILRAIRILKKKMLERKEAK